MSDTQDVKAETIALQLRQLRGFETQAKFAERLGISRDSLANYETGRTVPSQEKLDQFREALGLPPAYFAENLATQAMALLGFAGQPEFRPSPDEMAVIRLLRVVPKQVVLDVAKALLQAASRGLSGADQKHGEQLRSAVANLIKIVQDGGRFDGSKRNSGGEDALQEAQELARQAIAAISVK